MRQRLVCGPSNRGGSIDYMERPRAQMLIEAFEQRRELEKDVSRVISEKAGDQEDIDMKKWVSG